MEQQLSFGIVSSWMMLWISTVIIFVGIHFFLIEIMFKRPVYWHWVVIRVAFALLYGSPLYVLSFWECWPITLFQLVTHFVIYNPLLNRLREIKYQQNYLRAASNHDPNNVRDITPAPARYPFWYLGENSGYLDKLLGKFGPVFYQSLYYMCCALMILTMIVIYVRY